MITKEICAKEKSNFSSNYDRNYKITLKGCYKVVYIHLGKFILNKRSDYKTKL